MKTGVLVHKIFGTAVSLALVALLASAGVRFGPAFAAAGNRPSANSAAYSSAGQYASSYPTASGASSGAAVSGGTSPVSSTVNSAAGSMSSYPSSAVSSPSSAGTGSSPASSGTAVVSSQSQKQTVSSSPSVSSAASLSPSGSSAVPPPFVHPARMVVGYYGGWAAYSGFTPDKISASNLHVINYAFAKIGADLKITAGDPYIDYTNFGKLKSLKKSYPALKTVISVGGWDDSGKFSDAALTEASRAIFADSVVSFILANGFDGVDIDWEYPTGGGLATNISRSADKTNFGLLLKTLRAKLDAQGIKDGRHYILSFAGAANSGYAAGVGLSGLAQYVDYATIMTYDLHGGWDPFTDFNAPLYLPAGQSPQYKTSVDSAVRTWLNYGFPAGKLVMGVPFYGYAYQGAANLNNGLWQHFSSAATVGYDSIQSKYLSSASYKKFYDSTALVPWLFNGSTFVSYDDASSIQRKAQYAVSKNLLGVGAWELGFDKTGVLIRTIKNTLG